MATRRDLSGDRLPGEPGLHERQQRRAAIRLPPGVLPGHPAGRDPTTPCRLVPDVSAQADEFTGSITVYSAPLRRLVRRSAAPPLRRRSGPRWLPTSMPPRPARPSRRRATASASSARSFTPSPPTRRLRGSFNDITASNNDIYGLDDGLVFPARRGYDEASGLGSPRLTGSAGRPVCVLPVQLRGLGARPRSPGLSPARAARPAASGSDPRPGFEAGGHPDVAGSKSAPLSSLPRTSPSAARPRSPRPCRRRYDTLAARPRPPPGRRRTSSDHRHAEGRRVERARAGSRFQYVDTSSTGPIPSITGLIPIRAASNATPISGGRSWVRASTGRQCHLRWGSRAVHRRRRQSRSLPSAPPLSGATACAPLPTRAASSPARTRPMTSARSQVRVSDDRAAQARPDTILPPPEGPFVENTFGVQVLPTRCAASSSRRPPSTTTFRRRGSPRSRPRLGPPPYASESGGTVTTVHWRGSPVDDRLGGLR